jgi:hypothetical protein
MAPGYTLATAWAPDGSEAGTGEFGTSLGSQYVVNGQFGYTFTIPVCKFTLGAGWTYAVRDVTSQAGWYLPTGTLNPIVDDFRSASFTQKWNYPSIIAEAGFFLGFRRLFELNLSMAVNPVYIIAMDQENYEDDDGILPFPVYTNYRDEVLGGIGGKAQILLNFYPPNYRNWTFFAAFSYEFVRKASGSRTGVFIDSTTGVPPTGVTPNVPYNAGSVAFKQDQFKVTLGLSYRIY